MAWISWNTVLASKKYDGLGVSCFYALNRALLFKWVWQFFSQGSCLWTRFIKAIYGEDDALNSPSSLSKRSPWLDIIREYTVLRTKGVNLLYSIPKKVGNGYRKINHASMVDTFRRPPRGGVEEEELEATCEFSVKSVRQLIDDSILLNEEVATRWVKVMPIKINMFAWRVRLDKLPTRLNLSLKGLESVHDDLTSPFIPSKDTTTICPSGSAQHGRARGKTQPTPPPVEAVDCLSIGMADTHYVSHEQITSDLSHTKERAKTLRLSCQQVKQAPQRVFAIRLCQIKEHMLDAEINPHIESHRGKASLDLIRSKEGLWRWCREARRKLAAHSGSGDCETRIQGELKKRSRKKQIGSVLKKLFEDGVIKSDRDGEIREVYEKAFRMENPVRLVDEMSGELSMVKSDVAHNRNGSRGLLIHNPLQWLLLHAISFHAEDMCCQLGNQPVSCQ
ncbi:hypothetical protein Tco_1281980 [Tanacetum coccineum]